jgi:hypothetical protein
LRTYGEVSNSKTIEKKFSIFYQFVQDLDLQVGTTFSAHLFELSGQTVVARSRRISAAEDDRTRRWCGCGTAAAAAPCSMASSWASRVPGLGGAANPLFGAAKSSSLV